MCLILHSRRRKAPERLKPPRTRVLGKEWTLVWHHPQRPSLGEKRNSMNKLLLCVCYSGAEYSIATTLGLSPKTPKATRYRHPNADT